MLSFTSARSSLSNIVLHRSSFFRDSIALSLSKFPPLILHLDFTDSFADARLQSQLLLLNSWDNTHQRNNRRNDDSPELNVQHIFVERSLRSRCNCHQRQREHNVAAHPVVLVHSLRIILTAESLRDEEHSDTNSSLHNHEGVCDETKDGMWGLEVRDAVLDFVVLNNDQAGNEESNAQVIQSGMGIGALDFLVLCMRRLEDERALRDEQNAGAVKERVGREEDEVVAEDGAPDNASELPIRCQHMLSPRKYSGSICNTYDPNTSLRNHRRAQNKIIRQRLPTLLTRITGPAQERLLLARTRHTRFVVVRSHVARSLSQRLLTRRHPTSPKRIYYFNGCLA